MVDSNGLGEHQSFDFETAVINAITSIIALNDSIDSSVLDIDIIIHTRNAIEFQNIKMLYTAPRWKR